MYESPVTIYTQEINRQMNEHLEESVFRITRAYGIDVNKEELLKALAYDRGQYEKGYEDGRASAVVHAKWEINCDGYYPYCTDCKKEPENGIMSKYCPHCGAKMDKED